jgi:hypothetical protein
MQKKVFKHHQHQWKSEKALEEEKKNFFLLSKLFFPITFANTMGLSELRYWAVMSGNLQNFDNGVWAEHRVTLKTSLNRVTLAAKLIAEGAGVS